MPEARVIFRQRGIAPPRSMDCRRIVIYEASTPEYFSHCPRWNDKSSRPARQTPGPVLGGEVRGREGCGRAARCRAFVTKCASLAIYALFRYRPLPRAAGDEAIVPSRANSLRNFRPPTLYIEINLAELTPETRVHVSLRRN